MSTKKEIKKEMMENIARALDSITDDINRTEDADENLKRAEAIRTLAEAYRGMGL